MAEICRYGIYAGSPPRVDAGRVRLNQRLASAAGFAPLSLEGNTPIAEMATHRLLVGNRLEKQLLLLLLLMMMVIMLHLLLLVLLLWWNMFWQLRRFLMLLLMFRSEYVQIVQYLASKVSWCDRSHVQLLANLQCLG